MGEIKEPQPVNLIIGMLTSVEELFDVIESALEKEFGIIDLKSDIIPFDFTDYYQDEMGSSLERRFFGFDKLIMPDRLADIKLWTNQFEKELTNKSLASFGKEASPENLEIGKDSPILKVFGPPFFKKVGVSRPINLDPGYISETNLVLASTKDFFHRIYLKKGIYAEVTLKYANGQYESLPWTYLDYKTQQYQQFFLKVRELYRKKLKTAENDLSKM